MVTPEVRAVWLAKPAYTRTLVGGRTSVAIGHEAGVSPAASASIEGDVPTRDATKRDIAINDSQGIAHSVRDLLDLPEGTALQYGHVLQARDLLEIRDQRVSEGSPLEPPRPPSIEEEVIDLKHLCPRCTKMYITYKSKGRPLDRFKEPCGHQ